MMFKAIMKEQKQASPAVTRGALKRKSIEKKISIIKKDQNGKHKVYA